MKLDICNEKDLKKIFSLYKITEMYNLAANSFVESSFNSPLKTANTTGLSVLKILNTIKDQSPKTKFYQASSSEMYGNADTPYQSEKTSFYSRSISLPLHTEIKERQLYYIVEKLYEFYGVNND